MHELVDKVGLEVVKLKYCTVRNVNRKTKVNIDRVFISGVFRKRKTVIV